MMEGIIKWINSNPNVRCANTFGKEVRFPILLIYCTPNILITKPYINKYRLNLFLI